MFKALRNIRIVKLKNWRPAEMNLSEREMNRLMKWKPGKFSAFFSVASVIVLIIIMGNLGDNLRALYSSAHYGVPLETLNKYQREFMDIMPLLVYTPCLILLVILHESCHIIAFTNEAKAAPKDLVMGFPLVFAVGPTVMMSKTRYIVMLLAPVISLSAVFALILPLVSDIILSYAVKYLLLFNLCMSSSDISNAVSLLRIAPKHSQIYGNLILPPDEKTANS